MAISSVLVSFVVVLTYAAFAFVVRRNVSKTTFVSGGHGVQTPLVFMSLASTIIGPGFSMGFVGESAKSGWLWPFLSFAYGLQLVLVGRVLAPRIRERFAGKYTLGGVLADVNAFPGRSVQVTAGLFAALIMCGVAAVMLYSAATLGKFAYGWDPRISMVAFGIVATVYSATGGLVSILKTDAAQFIVFTLFFPALAIIIANNHDVPFSVIVSHGLDQMRTTSNTSLISVIGLALFFLAGDTLQPPFLSRILATDTPASSSRAFIYSGLYCWIWLLIMGILGILSAMTIGATGDTAILAVSRTALPEWGFAVLVIALFGIIMSGTDSIINSAAVTLSADCLFFERSTLRQLRILTLAVGLLSCVMAIMIPSVMRALLFLSAFWAPCLLVPLVASCFVGNMRRRSFFSAFIGGGISCTLSGLITQWNSGIDIVAGICGSAALLVSSEVWWRSQKEALQPRQLTKNRHYGPE